MTKDTGIQSAKHHLDSPSKSNRRAVYLDVYIFWVPYLTYSMFLASYVLSRHTKSLLSGEIGLLATGLALLAFTFLAGHVYLCFASGVNAQKRKARVALVFSALVYVVLLVVVQWALPPLDYPYTRTQRMIQSQLARRNQPEQLRFRGVDISIEFNDLGWPDKQRDMAPAADRIVFIGDSFLERRSSMNVARITDSLLHRGKYPAHVVNLSQSDTGLDQYRHRFYEVALDLEPRHIFLFLYESNDLPYKYVYQPYVHPPFRATKQALTMLRQTSLPTEVMTQLDRWQHKTREFTSKADVFAALSDTRLSVNQKLLIYLALYSYSYDRTQVAPVLPRLVSALSTSTTAIIDANQRRSRPGSPGALPDWREIYPRYKAIFEQPRDERLQAIASFIAHAYLGTGDASQCLKVLQEKNQQFRGQLTEQADMIYYLLPATAQAVGRDMIKRGGKVDTTKANFAADQYLKVLDEMHQSAKRRGIGLTVVLIPEASFADREFHQFWINMIDFQQYFAATHARYMSLKAKLTGKVPTLDLGEFADQLDGGYWKFDGHLNELGNQQVANILATYIQQ